jgi:hypothetical protein
MKLSLLTLARLNILLHIVGLAFAAFGMWPPLRDETFAEFVGSSPLGWTLGWATWMLCAVALIAFLATAVNRLPERAPLAWLGLTFAVVGLGFDLLCDSIYIFILPRLGQGFTPNLFDTLERITNIASLFIANGGYSVGILLIAADMKRSGRARPATTGVGYAVGICGLLLAATAFLHVQVFTAMAAAPTILLFCVWVVLVARDLE